MTEEWSYLALGDLGEPVSVPLDKLSFGLSPRFETVDPDHVRVLLDALDELPPILVRATDYVVIDGVHRTTAARKAGRTDILAYLYSGDADAAFALAVGANVRHGRPLSSRERSAAVRRLIELQPNWCDRRLAELCGVSAATVGGIRGSTTKSEQLNGRIGRDGRARPTDPAAQRRRIAEKLANDPSQSLREVAAEVGCAPATVMDVRNRLAEGRDPVPPKLQPSAVTSPVSPERSDKDASLFERLATEFAIWFGRTDVTDEAWRRFVNEVPLSRVYQLADEATRRAESWSRMAAALNRRASRG